jgi:membrane-associated phospholipid phosphatase
LIPEFQTILGIPNFPAYTSGHSVFSAAAAEVLSHLFPTERGVLEAWAREAAESRIYGGIHFRFDADEGIVQGRAVAAYAIAAAQADGG